MIFEGHLALEELLADVAVEFELVLVAFDVFIEKISAREGAIANVAAKFVRIRVKDVMSGQVIQARILTRADFTHEFLGVCVTALMVTQVTLLGKHLATGTASYLIGDLV